ncbi:hypothetical protein OEIGOIKO_08047 [Streptomyces chrestomyceticus JCM 4735]|uniref:DNA-binding phage zinc finger domain-containing protein n=1 Tax=Streptomyces chrestomyceticus JCM 4735 TaxID=1306181 RepID=A0A7U9Q2S4_9ACTN|nr:hypothetical protein [Streptomyces chrestomyceticus]GCD40190.1 hypothetical protein OEIGOIKO_08047 [Streptomyces chrestomyceticus JCM 4735]
MSATFTVPAATAQAAAPFLPATAGGSRRVPSTLSSTIPSPASDAAYEAAHETHRRFRHGVYSVQCPTCHVPAGERCTLRRAVHAARREAYWIARPGTTLVPLLVAGA